jgi:hypothetical protein
MPKRLAKAEVICLGILKQGLIHIMVENQKNFFGRKIKTKKTHKPSTSIMISTKKQFHPLGEKNGVVF